MGFRYSLQRFRREYPFEAQDIWKNITRPEYKIKLLRKGFHNKLFYKVFGGPSKLDYRFFYAKNCRQLLIHLEIGYV